MPKRMESGLESCTDQAMNKAAQDSRLRPAPVPLAGFGHISTGFDQRHGVHTARLLPGEYYVTVDPEVVVTVLGSCVSACIRDSVFGIGGMNHFMLPVHKGEDQTWGGSVVDFVTRFGNYAMEHLINTILSHGGVRKNLEIKVFGGGRILGGMSDIGAENIQFVFDYLRQERLPVAAKDVGGNYPRKICYFPKTGRVRLKKLHPFHHDTVMKREERYMREISKTPVAGDVELF